MVKMTLLSIIFLAFMCHLCMGQESGDMRMVPDKDDDDVESSVAKQVVNFASVSAGAVVLEASPKSKGYHNLLNDDKDKYGIAPCAEKKWVVIGLSEDIVIENIVLSNYEKYSSSLDSFQVLGSTSYPVSEWMNLGTFSAMPQLGDQSFQIPIPSWGRYLKFRFLTHHADEFYCTLSQIKVHGSTVIQNLQKEVERSTLETIDFNDIFNEPDDGNGLLEPILAGESQGIVDGDDTPKSHRKGEEIKSFLYSNSESTGENTLTADGVEEHTGDSKHENTVTTLSIAIDTNTNSSEDMGIKTLPYGSASVDSSSIFTIESSDTKMESDATHNSSENIRHVTNSPSVDSHSNTHLTAENMNNGEDNLENGIDETKLALTPQKSEASASTVNADCGDCTVDSGSVDAPIVPPTADHSSGSATEPYTVDGIELTTQPTESVAYNIKTPKPLEGTLFSREEAPQSSASTEMSDSVKCKENTSPDGIDKTEGSSSEPPHIIDTTEIRPKDGDASTTIELTMTPENSSSASNTLESCTLESCASTHSVEPHDPQDEKSKGETIEGRNSNNDRDNTTSSTSEVSNSGAFTQNDQAIDHHSVHHHQPDSSMDSPVIETQGVNNSGVDASSTPHGDPNMNNSVVITDVESLEQIEGLTLDGNNEQEGADKSGLSTITSPPHPVPTMGPAPMPTIDDAPTSQKILSAAKSFLMSAGDSVLSLDEDDEESGVATADCMDNSLMSSDGIGTKERNSENNVLEENISREMSSQSRETDEVRIEKEHSLSVSDNSSTANDSSSLSKADAKSLFVQTVDDANNSEHRSDLPTKPLNRTPSSENDRDVLHVGDMETDGHPNNASNSSEAIYSPLQSDNTSIAVINAEAGQNSTINNVSNSSGSASAFESANGTVTANTTAAAVAQSIVAAMASASGEINASAEASSPKYRTAAACFESLRFSEFQAKMKAKFAGQQQTADGWGGGIPASQDVFRTLMKKIISLEQNYKIVELFTVQIHECYQAMYREMDTINNKTLLLMEEEILRSMKESIMPDIAQLVQQEAPETTNPTRSISGTYSSLGSEAMWGVCRNSDCGQVCRDVIPATLSPSVQNSQSHPYRSDRSAYHWLMTIVYHVMQALGIYDNSNGVILWEVADLVMLCLLTCMVAFLVSAISLVCVVCMRKK